MQFTTPNHTLCSSAVHLGPIHKLANPQDNGKSWDCEMGMGGGEWEDCWEEDKRFFPLSLPFSTFPFVRSLHSPPLYILRDPVPF